MKIPPVHNMVVQSYKSLPTYFVTFGNCTTLINLTEPNGNISHILDYDSFYTDIIEHKPYLYISVKASTLDELKLEHPELFL